jgi:cytochrome c5
LARRSQSRGWPDPETLRFGSATGSTPTTTAPGDPADAIFTAARILREAKHAPPTGGSNKDYYNAVCGACGDDSAPYAGRVIARAAAYGFGGEPEDGASATRP